MERKILFVATIAKHILRFHLPYLKWFKDRGYEVHVACQGDEMIPFCDVRHHLPIERTPFSVNNLLAVKQLKEIVNSQEFKLVHCHTAMGAVITRLACNEARRAGTKVLYTAHGFHFFKGSPKSFWLLYYPIEKYLSKFTDAIITINREDFELVTNNKFGNGATYYINGVGVDTGRFTPVGEDEKLAIRKRNGLEETDFILIYVGEFISRKNHQFIIRAAKELEKHIPNLKILFAGRGILQSELERLTEQEDVQDTVRFLGFRNDIHDVMRMADVGISASRQEGLGLNLIEEMMVGLPVVATEDRGHKEIVINDKNGFLFPQRDQRKFTEVIVRLFKDEARRKEMGTHAIESAKKFNLDTAIRSMATIYEKYL